MVMKLAKECTALLQKHTQDFGDSVSFPREMDILVILNVSLIQKIANIIRNSIFTLLNPELVGNVSYILIVTTQKQNKSLQSLVSLLSMCSLVWL